jgi:hypothetical protein
MKIIIYLYYYFILFYITTGYLYLIYLFFLPSYKYTVKAFL